MDETGRDTAVEQQDGTEAVADAGAPSSGAERETENSFFNRALRGMAGVLGLGASDGREETEQTDDQATPEAAQPATIALTPEELEARIQREAQSRADRLDAQRRWDGAVKNADEGDPTALQELAEQGNRRAERELANRGLTYEVGAARAKALGHEQQHEAQTQVFDQFRVAWDAAVLEPVLGAVSDEAREKILAEGVAGIEGRTKAVTEAVAAIKREAGRQAVTRALSDEKYTKDLLAPGSPLLKELLRNPVSNKQIRASLRPESEESDITSGLGPGRGAQTENTVMNDAIRNAWRGAVDRAPTEHAAGAGARNGRSANRDLLDDP